ncbi:hypothetical protein GQ602_005355 [Ophiocordyceps camponoti-floridani]|uniref:Uncharacterized protein n=1 Tax=Ophiocordyceps camponoti-floridani TaxID=2030778 RepID=A0A8H4VCX4_9HYPO|nr:hypothetical protein GQ602_005355 [Ophiocordyceps camponoti-floridani]
MKFLAILALAATALAAPAPEANAEASPGGWEGRDHYGRSPFYRDGSFFFDDGYYEGRWYSFEFFRHSPRRCERQRYCCDREFNILGFGNHGHHGHGRHGHHGHHHGGCDGGSWLCCDGGFREGHHIDYHGNHCHPDYYRY